MLQPMGLQEVVHDRETELNNDDEGDDYGVSVYAYCHFSHT